MCGVKIQICQNYIFVDLSHNFQTTPEIEEKVINRTKSMLEEEYLPELSLELHSNLSFELKRETNAVEDRLKIILNEKDKEIQKLKAKVDTLEAVVNRYNGQISTLVTKTNNLETQINHMEELEETTPRPRRKSRNCRNANMVDTEENCDLTFVSLHFFDKQVSS